MSGRRVCLRIYVSGQHIQLFLMYVTVFILHGTHGSLQKVLGTGFKLRVNVQVELVKDCLGLCALQPLRLKLLRPMTT